MPEEPVVNQAEIISPIVTQPRKPSLNKFLSTFLLILVIGSLVTFTYFLLNKKQVSTTKVVTGLDRDQITLGWTTLSGVYPTNSSTPTVGDNNFNNSIFEALVEAKGSEVTPVLATKWTNPSTTTWRFNIRSGVKFQSGEALTAEDVKYSFDQAIASASSDNPWPSVNSVSTVKEVRVVNSNTVDIETLQPDPILLYRITDVFILSKKQVSRNGLAKAVGTGPYQIDSFEKDKKATLSLNQNYWWDKPKVKKATFVVYEDDAALLKALRAGLIDYAKIGSVNVTIPTNFRATKFDDPRVVMLFFNFAAAKVNGKDNPLLTKSVRQAVKFALDNKKIIKEASVSGSIANQFVTKEIVGYNKGIKDNVRNVTLAKQLLADNQINNLSFSLYTTADRKSVADAVVKQLQDANITATVVVSPNFGGLVKKLFTGEITAFIAGPSANDGGEYIESIFKTAADQNILSYSNKTVDAGIAKANKTFTPKERRDILEGLVQTIVDDVPVIPFYSVTNTYIMRDNFDYQISAFADFSLKLVSGRQEVITSN